MSTPWDNQTLCATVKEMIDAVKAHYKAVGGVVVSADDADDRTIGFAVGRSRWSVRIVDAMLTAKAHEDTRIYADFMRGPTGRAQLAKLIMTAARSEPPPPMNPDEEE